MLRKLLVQKYRSCAYYFSVPGMKYEKGFTIIEGNSPFDSNFTKR